MKTRLTNKDGEVRGLTGRDVKQMRPMSEALPSNLQRTIGQRGKQPATKKVKVGSDALIKP